MMSDNSVLEQSRTTKQGSTRDMDIPTMAQGRKAQSNSSRSIGKHTKSNQKGEELPFYEVRNIIYRPGGEFFFLFVILVVFNHTIERVICCVGGKR